MTMVLIFKYSLQHTILSLYHASLVLFSVNHFLLDIFYWLLLQITIILVVQL